MWGDCPHAFGVTANEVSAIGAELVWGVRHLSTALFSKGKRRVRHDGSMFCGAAIFIISNQIYGIFRTFRALAILHGARCYPLFIDRDENQGGQRSAQRVYVFRGKKVRNECKRVRKDIED